MMMLMNGGGGDDGDDADDGDDGDDGDDRWCNGRCRFPQPPPDPHIPGM